MYNLLQPRMDIILFEIIFPLMCFNDNDQKLWDEDPHEYVRKGYGESLEYSHIFCGNATEIVNKPVFSVQ